MPNYYEILEVKKDATLDDIKHSFRKLALRYHPDKNKNSAESKEKFLKIVEAYEILYNKDLKRSYDQSLESHPENYRYPRKHSWTPPADFYKIYSYSNLKYKQENGGIWNISEAASAGMWKATLVLFASLAAMTVLILFLK